MDGVDRDGAESDVEGADAGPDDGSGSDGATSDDSSDGGETELAADATEPESAGGAPSFEPASDAASDPPDDAAGGTGTDSTDDADALPEGTWTVAELNDEIDDVLAAVQPRFPDYVVGEVADVGAYDYGTFFELRDLEAEPSIQCVAWRSSVADFDHELEAGTEAVVEADVDFYPDRGDTQLVVSGYWPVGESARQRELAELRRELEAEGLFDDDRKRPIPDHPACVGLVTSTSGSAREDAWRAISERSPRTDVTLCGATVQGEGAVPSLLRAIRRLDADPEVETLLLTRGGGSDVDLHCFDAEPLVRCVAACETPVIAAIGHEDDEALVEEVADQRAMTPTQAGDFATTPVEHVLAELSTVERRVDEAYRSLVEDRLEDVERRVETAHDQVRQRVERQVATLRRAGDLERRIDANYRALWTTRLDDLDVRIEAGYRDAEAAAEIEAGAAEARRLKVVVAVLLAILVLGAIAVVLFLL